MILVKLFYSILFIGIGVLLVRYRKNVKSRTGDFLWAEKYLGSGGTYLVILGFGLFLIFLGVIYPFGGLDYLRGGDDGRVDTSSIIE